MDKIHVVVSEENTVWIYVDNVCCLCETDLKTIQIEDHRPGELLHLRQFKFSCPMGDDPVPLNLFDAMHQWGLTNEDASGLARPYLGQSYIREDETFTRVS